MNSLLTLMAADPAAGAGTASMMTTIITFVLIILIFYFLIIRPQKKKDKETKAMLAAMKKGDKVVTIGGIHDDSARIEFSKNAISTVSSRNAEKTAPKKEKAEALENGGEAGSIQGASPAAEEDKED